MQTNSDFESCMVSIGLAIQEIQRCEKVKEDAIKALERKEEILRELLRPVIDRAIELCNFEVSTPSHNSKYKIVPNYEVQFDLEKECFDLRGSLRDSSDQEPDYELDCPGSSTDEKIPEIFHSIISEELLRHGIWLTFRKLNFPGHYYSF
ncbi:MAG: hypothetical protein WCJ74_02015 [bacterium]